LFLELYSNDSAATLRCIQRTLYYNVTSHVQMHFVALCLMLLLLLLLLLPLLLVLLLLA
jgi:hypothetical protein